MYENMRADLPDTLIGAPDRGRDVACSGTPPSSSTWASRRPDAPSLVRRGRCWRTSRPPMSGVDASWASIAGLSQRAAFHLHDLARLLPVMNAADRRDGGRPGRPRRGAAPAPALDIAGLREQARRLVDDLRGAGRESLGDAKPAPPGRDALIADLDGLVDLVEGFDRLLATGPSVRDAIESLRLVRSPPVADRGAVPSGRHDPRSGRPLAVDPAADQRPLRPFRSVPRDLARPGRRSRPPGVDRRLLAQADRAVVALDAFLSSDGPSRAAAAGGLGVSRGDRPVAAAAAPVPPAGGRGGIGRAALADRFARSRPEPAARRTGPGRGPDLSRHPALESPRPPGAVAGGREAPRALAESAGDARTPAP